MSHWTQIQAEFRNENILRKAIDALGFTCKENTTARGYSSMTFPLVMKLSSYDVGFRRESDENGSRLVPNADLWRGSVERDLGSGLGKLKQEYSRQAVKSWAEKRRMSMHEKAQEDGTIQVRVSA